MRKLTSFFARPLLIALAAAASCGAAQAAGTALNLGNYSVTATYALDINPGSLGVSGLEASAVTYARDRNSLFYVGDEGTGVIEISLTGRTLGTMAFDWSGTGSTKHDTESLAYLGNGQLVVGEERLYDAYKFTYGNGGSARLANAGVSISNDNVGNDGLEGLAYDPRNGGSFVSVKQDVPEDVRAGTLSFGANLTGVSTLTTLFDPTKLGLSTLSDVAVLSTVDSLAGTAAADHLLFLSLGSRMLVEADRSGNVISRFDLSNVLAHNGIEGVTIDENGTIYLVAEQIQDGTAPANAASQLILLSALAPVPEPASATLMAIGALSLFGLALQRRRNPR
jgi:uncharacterized protein YjiK